MPRLKFKKPRITYRGRIQIVVIGLVIGISSLFFTNRLASQLREKEKNDVALWSFAFTYIAYFDTNDPLYKHIVQTNRTIPFILTDENLVVKDSYLIPEKILKSKDALRRKLERLENANPHLDIQTFDGMRLLFYDRSQILKALYYFPYIQITIIGVFIMFSFIAFNSSKRDEQNRVWIGMAKETAHQLGTPTSSLLGWIEYLKSKGTEDFVIEEMNKDLTRLLKIVDRFSKIGAETYLTERNVADIVENTVTYFRSRIPRNTDILYSSPAMPVCAMVNEALFEWVLENLLKNALDAMQGKGAIVVTLKQEDKFLNIDVKDSGKGIPKANFKRIFEPGYTTKTRGWGLGLSLSRRIIEDYHKGRIFVLESEADRGTTMRISLRSA